MPLRETAIQTLEGIGHTPESLYHLVLAGSGARFPGLHVVALPGQRLPAQTFGNGHEVVLVRVALGEPGLAYATTLAGNELLAPQQLAAQGVAVEEGPAGGYAVVVEHEPHAGLLRARRITDASGVVAAGQMLLRLRRQEAAGSRSAATDALADDDEQNAGLKSWDPSPEVPDLLHGQVTAIQAVLVSDPDKALRLLLFALQSIDARKFAAGDLGGKLVVAHDTSDDPSDARSHDTSTAQGPVFVEWLETYLGTYARDLSKAPKDLTSAEVKKAIGAAAPPKEKRDIRLQVAPGHFASVALLYSTVRHEFVHVEQMRSAYLAHVPTSVMPRGVGAPDSGTVLPDRELEAYLWEMENLANTGLKAPGELHLLWEKCSNAWLNAGPDAKKLFGDRFRAAFATVWKAAMDGYIALVGNLHATFKKDAKVADDGALATAHSRLGQMWRYRADHGNPWTKHQGPYEAAKKQIEEMRAAAKADEIRKQLDAADKALAAGTLGPQDAYRTWFALLNLWINLPEPVLAIHVARFKVTAPKLWDKAFSLFEVEIRQRISEGNAREADTLLQEKIGTLWKHLDKTHVKAAAYEQRRRALQDEVKKSLEALRKGIRPQAGRLDAADQADEPGVVGPPPADAFPSAYATPFTDDPALTAKLAAAITAATTPGLSADIPISIVVLKDDGTRLHAGNRHEEMHYSGSLIKIAALYAAFELRAAVNRVLAAKPATTPRAALDELVRVLNPQIAATAAKEITALPAASLTKVLQPDYATVFKLPPAGGKTSFTNLMQGFLTSMIVVGTNTHASKTIHALGYGYISAALIKGGFFKADPDPLKNKGLWLATDYVRKGDPGNWDEDGRVACVNDTDAASGTTTVQLAKLMTLMVDRKLVDGDSSDAMLKFLKGARDSGFKPWILRSIAGPASFKVTHNKLGEGDLKAANGGGLVMSEASIITDVKAGVTRRFVVVWQNVSQIGPDNDQFGPVARLVKEFLARV